VSSNTPGRLVGEGFDHPPLDTLVLAMPISWKGTLAQYAGRLHREHATKDNVRIIDVVDTGHPALQRMWEKRRRGYRAMGYRIVADVDREETTARLL
jgi:superfamily II DNA or RNA helicase